MRERYRRLVAGIGGFMVFASLAATSASAQTGVIAFRDDCNMRLYAMRGDGTGRVALPLPSLPDPATDRYWSPYVLDVTTSGPPTVIYYVGISRQNQLALVDDGLFAVQLNDDGGVLTAGTAVPLSLPPIAGVDPNRAVRGAFSPIGSGDRLALVANNLTSSVLMTARVDRDANSRIIGLSDLVAVGDLYSIGTPDPKFPTAKGSGTVDYSPDGGSIVASVYLDLWMINLQTGNTYLSAERLTQNTDGFTEWNPAFAPDGSRIAFTAGPITRNGGVRDPEIYSLALETRAVTSVTTSKNKGAAASSRNNAIWSADGEWIGFSASVNTRTPRGSACSDLVNSEIFLIKADGSTIATPLTNTNGTSVEAWPKWGW